MIREVIRPQSSKVTIEIPDSYIDREIEFTLSPLDEEKVTYKHKKSLRGVFNKYAYDTKVALEDSAWQNHVMDKFRKDD